MAVSKGRTNRWAKVLILLWIIVLVSMLTQAQTSSSTTGLPSPPRPEAFEAYGFAGVIFASFFFLVCVIVWMGYKAFSTLLCNPPAEQMATHGDYELLGMFEGAGEAVYAITDEKLRDEFAAMVTEIEADYIAARKALADNMVRRMDEAFHLVLDREQGSSTSETDEMPVDQKT